MLAKFIFYIIKVFFIKVDGLFKTKNRGLSSKLSWMNVSHLVK